MHDTAILIVQLPRQCRCRFLSPLSPDEVARWQGMELPTGWQVRQVRDLERECQPPVLFDQVGPVDLRPVLQGWQRDGCLHWDLHQEIEQASCYTNRLLAAKLCGWIYPDHGAPLPAGPSTELTDALLPVFARSWQHYENMCSRLQEADHQARRRGDQWFSDAVCHAAWHDYTHAVRDLKAVSCSLLEQTEGMPDLPFLLIAELSLELPDR